MTLPDRFRQKDWVKLISNQRVKFKLKTYEDILGHEDFQLWDNQAKRFLEATSTTPGRKSRFVREVIVEGKDCCMGIPKTANDSLRSVLNTLRATNADPLKALFEILKTGEGLSTRYSITLVGMDPSPSQSNPEKQYETAR